MPRQRKGNEGESPCKPSILKRGCPEKKYRKGPASSKKGFGTKKWEVLQGSRKGWRKKAARKKWKGGKIGKCALVRGQGEGTGKLRRGAGNRP